MAADLRRTGIRAEVYLGNPKNFGNQLKYAGQAQTARSPSSRAKTEKSKEPENGYSQGPDPRRETGPRRRTLGGMEIPAGAGRGAAAGILCKKTRKLLDRHRYRQGHPSGPRAAGLQAMFEAAGAQPVEADLLLPAETLLRPLRRGYPRPRLCHPRPGPGRDDAAPGFHRGPGGADAHGGAAPTPPANTYMGEVFRHPKAAAGSARPSEIPAGRAYEVLRPPPTPPPPPMPRSSRCSARRWRRWACGAVTGDIGILMAAIDTLSTTDGPQGGAPPSPLAAAPLPARCWNRFTGRAPGAARPRRPESPRCRGRARRR